MGSAWVRSATRCRSASAQASVAVGRRRCRTAAAAYAKRRSARRGQPDLNANSPPIASAGGVSAIAVTRRGLGVGLTAPLARHPVRALWQELGPTLHCERGVHSSNRWSFETGQLHRGPVCSAAGGSPASVATSSKAWAGSAAAPARAARINHLIPRRSRPRGALGHRNPIRCSGGRDRVSSPRGRPRPPMRDRGPACHDVPTGAT
jgi:hypothetical protein